MNRGIAPDEPKTELRHNVAGRFFYTQPHLAAFKWDIPYQRRSRPRNLSAGMIGLEINKDLLTQ